MSAIFDFLVRYGGMLLSGSTLLLGCGALAALCFRAPAYRQRICELSVFATLLWLAIAILPLPRRSLSEFFPWLQAAPQNESAVIAETPKVVSEAEALDRINLLLHLEPSANQPIAYTTPHGTAPQSPMEAFSGWSLAGFFCGIYLVGVVIVSLYLLIGRIWLQRIFRRSKEPESRVLELADELATTHEVASPSVRVSADSERPFAWGIVWQMIILPVNICELGRRAALRYVLLHELCHVRRRDAVGAFVLNAGLPFLFFHPVFWWLRGQARWNAELIADDWAANRTEKCEYARELVGLARQHRFRLQFAGQLGMSWSSKSFARRMDMLLCREKPLAAGCSRLWRSVATVAFVSAAFGFATVVGVDRLQAQDREEVEAARREAVARRQAAIIAEKEAVQAEILAKKLAAVERDQSSDAQAEISVLRKKIEALQLLNETREKKLVSERDATKEAALRQQSQAHALLEQAQAQADMTRAQKELLEQRLKGLNKLLDKNPTEKDASKMLVPARTRDELSRVQEESERDTFARAKQLQEQKNLLEKRRAIEAKLGGAAGVSELLAKDSDLLRAQQRLDVQTVELRLQAEKLKAEKAALEKQIIDMKRNFEENSKEIEKTKRLEKSEGAKDRVLLSKQLYELKATELANLNKLEKLKADRAVTLPALSNLSQVEMEKKRAKERSEKIADEIRANSEAKVKEAKTLEAQILNNVEVGKKLALDRNAAIENEIAERQRVVNEKLDASASKRVKELALELSGDRVSKSALDKLAARRKAEIENEIEAERNAAKAQMEKFAADKRSTLARELSKEHGANSQTKTTLPKRTVEIQKEIAARQAQAKAQLESAEARMREVQLKTNPPTANADAKRLFLELQNKAGAQSKADPTALQPAGGSKERAALDMNSLLQLTTSLLDAVEKRDQAATSLSLNEKLLKKNMISQEEFVSEKLKLEANKRRVAVLRLFLQTNAELLNNDMHQLESNVNLLRSANKSGPEREAKQLHLDSAMRALRTQQSILMRLLEIAQ